MKLVCGQCPGQFLNSPELQRHPSMVLLYFMLVLKVYRTESETVPLMSLALTIRRARLCLHTMCPVRGGVSSPSATL